MTRENRANFLFLGILGVLMLPGFVILMRRKLNGHGESNAMPDPVPSQIAYMQPLPAPPVPRREPRVVRQWVRQITQAQAGGGASAKFGPNDTQAAPLVSDAFITQFIDLAFSNNGGTARVRLLHWADDDLRQASPVVSLDTGHTTIDAPADQLEPIDVPLEVRHALQGVGYLDPPKRVWWVSAEMPFPGAESVRTIALTRRTPKGPFLETLLLPTPATRPSEARP